MSRQVCIFCGAKQGVSNKILEDARQLCALLIAHDFDLVYGGGSIGLMGIIADHFLQKGRKVIGVRPKKLITDEDCHQGLSQLIVVETMQDRKAKMIELSDYFIALPGGIGTLDEIIETFTLFKIGFIQKPSGILNTSNFYGGLKSLFDQMTTSGFLSQEANHNLIFADTPSDLLHALKIEPKKQTTFREIDKVALIALNKGKILSTRSFGKESYYLPGGKREAGESDQQTLFREIKEELNIELLEDTIDYIGTFSAQADGMEDGILVKMTCYQADFNQIPQASNEIEEVRWLSYSDIELVSAVDKIIFKALKAKGQLM